MTAFPDTGTAMVTTEVAVRQQSLQTEAAEVKARCLVLNYITHLLIVLNLHLASHRTYFYMGKLNFTANQCNVIYGYVQAKTH